jgi:hypothetical protein
MPHFSVSWYSLLSIVFSDGQFIMFATEPIVLCLSLLSGFADALIFTFLESFGPIFRQWNFGTIALGLAFIPLLIGYVISYLSFIPFIKANEKSQARDPDNFQPEEKLYWVNALLSS